MDAEKPNNQSYLAYALGGWLAFLFVLASFNYYVDAFGIFRPDQLFPNFGQVNIRYRKIEYLEGHRGMFNAFILGSSRVARTRPTSLERYYPSLHFYNMAAPSANQWDNLLLLRYFLRHNYPIKMIYLQLDPFFKYGQQPEIFAYRHHPHVTGENENVYHFNYLRSIYYGPSQTKLLIQQTRNITGTVVDWQSGVWFHPEYEGGVAPPPEKLITVERDFISRPREHFSPLMNEHIDANIRDLAEIIDLCKKNNIRLILFTPPINRFHLDKFHIDTYLYFLQRLGNLTPFWDFCYYNSVTEKDTNYVDPGHYRQPVSVIIASRIFDNGKNAAPDFGILVTQDGLASHLSYIERNFLQHDLHR